MRWLVFIVVFLLSAPARADDRTAAAELAYEEGKSLLGAGRYAEACAKLEESVAIEEAMGARFSLAECYEKLGKPASAWRNYVAVTEAAQRAGMADRAAFAAKRAAEVRARVATVRVVLAEPVRALAPEVRHNDVVLAPEMVGVELPVDPGEQRFEVRAPGYLPFTARVTIGAGAESQRVDVPALTRASSRGVPPLAIGGLSVGGLGVAAIAVSIALGVTAKGDYEDALEAHCLDAACDAEALEQTEDARALGTAGTALFAAGAGVAAAGIVMAIIGFTGESQEQASLRAVPIFDAQGGMLVVQGSF
jgi:hypothetical protein